MLKTYRYLAMAIGTLVVVQAAAIAFAMFGLAHDVDSNGVVVDDNYDGNAGFAVHAIVGQMLIPLLALVLLIIGIVVRKSPGALRWAVIVFALVALQVALAFASFGVPIIGALHGINALLILLASFKAVTVVPRDASTAAAA